MIKNFNRDFITLTDAVNGGMQLIKPDTIHRIFRGKKETQLILQEPNVSLIDVVVTETPEEIADIYEKWMADCNELDEANYDKQQEVLIRRSQKQIDTQKKVNHLQEEYTKVSQEIPALKRERDKLAVEVAKLKALVETA